MVQLGPWVSPTLHPLSMMFFQPPTLLSNSLGVASTVAGIVTTTLVIAQLSQSSKVCNEHYLQFLVPLNHSSPSSMQSQLLDRVAGLGHGGPVTNSK